MTCNCTGACRRGAGCGGGLASLLGKYNDDPTWKDFPAFLEQYRRIVDRICTPTPLEPEIVKAVDEEFWYLVQPSTTNE